VSALAAISVDLDTLPHYCRIQGIPEGVLDERALRLVEDVAIPRLLELYDGAKGTFFAIGEDAARPSMARALQASHAAGVEISSHSHAHDYALSRQPPEAIAQDLARAAEAIAAATGVRPPGFRAPGYTLSAALLGAVAAQGHAYDSSAFPAAPYYAAKAMVMGALALLGRPSRSVLDRPRVLLSPRVPYRPSLSEPYARGTAPLVELPMAVAKVSRVPFIGTTVTSLPWAVVRSTYQGCRDAPLLNLELHAVDVLDESDGVPAVLVRQQRDLKVKASEKLRRLREVRQWLSGDGELVTLAEASIRLAGSL